MAHGHGGDVDSSGNHREKAQDVFAFCRPEGAIAGAAIVQQMASAAMDDDAR